METWKKQIREIDSEIRNLKEKRSSVRTKITQEKLSKFMKRDFVVTRHFVENMDYISEANITINIPSIDLRIFITSNSERELATYICEYGDEEYEFEEGDPIDTEEMQEIIALCPEFIDVFITNVYEWIFMDN